MVDGGPGPVGMMGTATLSGSEDVHDGMTGVAEDDPGMGRPTNARDHGVRTTVARTLDEVEDLRSNFEQLPSDDIDSDLDFFSTVNRHQEGVIRPHVMVLQLASGRHIRIVARLVERRSRLPVRPLRILQVTFGGVVGLETNDDCALAVGALQDALRAGDADMVSLPKLEVGGRLYEAGRAAAPWWRREPMGQQSVHWRAKLPDSVDLFMKARSGKTRANIRYYARKLRSAHGEALTVRAFHDMGNFKRLLADIEAIAAKTYQRGLGVGYTGDPMQTALMELAGRRGSLRAWVLYIHESPAAFWFGYCYRGTFWSMANAFDTAYSDLRIGQYLQMQVMEELCKEPDVHAFDWGAGDAEYKRRFGDEVTEHADVVLYRASVRGTWTCATRTVQIAARRNAKAWVGETGVGKRAKKAWRSRAEKRARRVAKSKKVTATGPDATHVGDSR